MSAGIIREWGTWMITPNRALRLVRDDDGTCRFWEGERVYGMPFPLVFPELLDAIRHALAMNWLPVGWIQAWVRESKLLKDALGFDPEVDARSRKFFGESA